MMSLNKVLLNTKEYVPVGILIEELFNSNGHLSFDNHILTCKVNTKEFKSILKKSKEIIERDTIIFNTLNIYNHYNGVNESKYTEKIINEKYNTMDDLNYMCSTIVDNSILYNTPLISIIKRESLDRDSYIHKIGHVVYLKKEFISEFLYMFLFNQKDFRKFPDLFVAEYDKELASQDKILSKTIDILFKSKIELKEKSNIFQKMDFAKPEFAFKN